MKYEIMMRILFEMLSKKSVSASYLAEKYEVSKRSVYRYIENIELAGVPIVTKRGAHGGFSIMDTYRLSSSFLTIDEYESVISSLEAIIKQVPNKQLQNALIKLQAVIKNERCGFELKSGNLVIDAGPWGDATSYKNKLKIVEECIEKQYELEIRYHDRNGEITERVIEPHTIVFKQGLWYVFAYCNLRKDFRFFKTGRIEQANILRKKFIRRDLSKIDLPFDTWYNSSDVIEVQFEIKKNALSEIEEWLGIENIFVLPSGKITASVRLPDDDSLAVKILSYGNGLKVLSPLSLKKKIVEMANQVIGNYI